MISDGGWAEGDLLACASRDEVDAGVAAAAEEVGLLDALVVEDCINHSGVKPRIAQRFA